MPKNKLAELVAAAKRKDNTAISVLYEQTHNRIYFTTLMIVKNEQDALDIMQETYISAFRKLSSLKNPEAFEGWLQTIARNKCRNFLKKHKELLVDEEQEYLFEQIEDTSEEFLPAEALESKEMQEIILESIKALPVKLSKTVLYYYFDEMTTTEIASAMSCPTSTVSRRLAAARDRIKEELIEKRRLFTIMPLPVLTHIFKQTIKENTKWMASAQQSATCLEGIITGVHLSTSAIISAGVKKLLSTTAGKTIAIGTSVIITSTIAVVFLLPEQDSPYGTAEISQTTVSTESFESDVNPVDTYSSEVTETYVQTNDTDVISNTELTSFPQVTESQNNIEITTPVTSALATTTAPPVTTVTPTITEPLTRVNGILIKNLNILDETYSDLWSIKYGFSESNLIFSDRNFTFVTLPDSFTNLERIQLACDSKFLQTDVAKFTAGDDITVYIAMDSRVVAKGIPAWMNSWTTESHTAFLSNDVTFNFYKKDFAKGEEVTLGTNGEPSSVIMYTVFVSPKN